MEPSAKHIVIRGSGGISPLGYDEASTSQAYRNGTSGFKNILHQQHLTPVAALTIAGESRLQELVAQNPAYKQLDRSVLLAIHAARQAVAQAGWQLQPDQLRQVAVNMGSSRGATGLFEHHFEAFQNQHLSSSASPTTTLGNLSSWVAQDIGASGAQISHSITCSTALMAVANGVAWLKAGMADYYLAGGTEAPLTDFTIAQMKAVGIYSRLHDSLYPCQPYATQKQNTFVLGEGAAAFALEKVGAEALTAGDVTVEAVGFGFEKIESKTGISREGLNFQQAMRQAVEQLHDSDKEIDLIITHTPGTHAGDQAELAAIRAVFENNLPALSTNKWLVGHTLGASGALSIQYALHVLKQQQYSAIPYSVTVNSSSLNRIERIMINAAGFGGNASSVILKRLA